MHGLRFVVVNDSCCLCRFDCFLLPPSHITLLDPAAFNAAKNDPPTSSLQSNHIRPWSLLVSTSMQRYAYSTKIRLHIYAAGHECLAPLTSTFARMSMHMHVIPDPLFTFCPQHRRITYTSKHESTLDGLWHQHVMFA